MEILVACEESQAVCKELRKRGHTAFSCDLIPCSGGHPEWHILGDVLPLLNGRCTFTLETGDSKEIKTNWDMVIAFPPCTDLAISGARWFTEKRKNGQQKKAIDFFLTIANADCEKIAIENPVGIMSTFYRKPDQIINPYLFGDPYEKKTCLWLKNLPPLKPTNIVTPPERIKFKSGKTMPKWYAEAYNLPEEERRKVRSKTFKGIALAMATQWA